MSCRGIPRNTHGKFSVPPNPWGFRGTENGLGFDKQKTVIFNEVLPKFSTGAQSMSSRPFLQVLSGADRNAGLQLFCGEE